MNALHPPVLPLVTLAILAPCPRWVAWQIEERGPGQPTTKIPYAPSGDRARADDPRTWGTKTEAEARFAKLPLPFGRGGTGLELGDLGGGWHLGGIDLDTCRAPDGTLSPWAAAVVARFASYTEVSPSGEGVKMFFVYPAAALPFLRAAMGTDWSKAWKPASDMPHPPAIELHLGNRYFAVTDERLPGTPLEFRPVSEADILWLIRETGPAFAGKLAHSAPRLPVGDSVQSDGLLRRIEAQAALRPDLGRRWGGDWSGLSDGSASGRAFALGGALKRAGFTRAEMADALATHCDTAQWTAEKGKASHEREIDRIWHNAGSTIPEPDAPWPAINTDLATADPLPPPDLPLREVFPLRCADWIEKAAEAKSAPPDYIACALLAVAGGLIGNARWATPWEGWAEPPVLNVALVGNPSAGKSPALDALTEHLSAIQAEANANWIERRRDHATAKQAASEREQIWQTEVKKAVKEGIPAPIKPADAMEPDAPQKRRVMSSDPTVAKAERMADANPRGLLLQRDELAGWIAGLDRYSGGGDRQFWLQAFGGRPWSPDRVKDGDKEIAVPHLTWGIVGTIQPDRLAELMMGGADDGLTARFLYCWPPSQPPRRPAIGLVLPPAGEWLARLRALPWQPPEPFLVAFDEAAQATLHEWRLEVAKMEADASGLFLSWLGKLPGFAVRVALILRYLDWTVNGRGDPPETVRESDLLMALKFLADYALPMARRVFGEAALPEAERDARRLARWLLRQFPVPKILNARALRRTPNGPGIGSPARIDAALDELAGLGWVRRAPSNNAGSGGRSKGDWIVSPKLTGGQHGVA